MRENGAMAMGDDAANLILEQLRIVRADQAQFREDMSQRLTTIGQRLDHLDTQVQGLTYVVTTAIGSLVADQRDIKDRLAALENA
jgi:hypothetical protein